MNKKILVILIIVIAAAALGYFFLYQKPEKPQVDLGDQKPTSENEECGQLVNKIFDGILSQINKDFIVVRLKGERGETETIKLTEETEFKEIFLSEQMEVFSQEEINRDDLNEGDQVSVVALCDKVKPEIESALIVRRMVVKEIK